MMPARVRAEYGDDRRGDGLRERRLARAEEEAVADRQGDLAEADRLQPGKEGGGLDRVVGVALVVPVQAVAGEAVGAVCSRRLLGGGDAELAAPARAWRVLGHRVDQRVRGHYQVVPQLR